MGQAQHKRIVFMGTPEFAATILQILLESRAFEIVGVFTQPNRPAGRGQKIVPSPVHLLAEASALPVFQPETVRQPEAVAQLASLAPDFLVVAAYGLILPQAILDIPAIAALNVHASLLPRYRGAAPVQRAIMENWLPGSETGVSIMQMTAGLDTGPVYASAATPVGRKNSAELLHELAVMGGHLLLATLDDILQSGKSPLPQDDRLATYAAKLQKKDGVIEWDRPLLAVDAQVRGVTPWPGARTTLFFHEKPMPVTILSGSPGELEGGLIPGQLRRVPHGLEIACADGWYILEKILPAGRKPMTAADVANGHCSRTVGICGYAQ